MSLISTAPSMTSPRWLRALILVGLLLLLAGGGLGAATALAAGDGKKSKDKKEELPVAPLENVTVTEKRIKTSVGAWKSQLRSGPVLPGNILGGQAVAQPANNDRATDPDNPCNEETSKPVVVASGNKVLDEVDFATATGDFVLSRTYSRAGGFFNGFGNNWTWSFNYYLGSFVTNPNWSPVCLPGTYEGPWTPCPLYPGKYLSITAVRPDGRKYQYEWNASTQRYEDSRPQSTSWITEYLESSAPGSFSEMTLHREDGGKETYTENGLSRPCGMCATSATPSATSTWVTP